MKGLTVIAVVCAAMYATATGILTEHLLDALCLTQIHFEFNVKDVFNNWLMFDHYPN